MCYASPLIGFSNSETIERIRVDLRNESPPSTQVARLVLLTIYIFIYIYSHASHTNTCGPICLRLRIASSLLSMYCVYIYFCFRQRRLLLLLEVRVL